MIVAVDVHYRDQLAKAVSIEFSDWDDAFPSKINVVQLKGIHEYIPGAFYKRELPCIMEVLKKTEKQKIELIIVDGYVTLNDSGKYGLGGYLFETLNREIPVIGVAKRTFATNNKNVAVIYRGKSKNPLYITSIGIDLELAGQYISKMKGKFRIPDLLRMLDQKTKENPNTTD